MADKVGKKPVVTAGGAKNIAAAKAAFGVGGAAATGTSSNGSASPFNKNRATEGAKKENSPQTTEKTTPGAGKVGVSAVQTKAGASPVQPVKQVSFS
jgi:hypothetical protein